MATEGAAPTSPEVRQFLGLAREVIQHLSVLFRNAYLHDLTNEIFAEPLEKVEAVLARIFAAEGSFRLERSGKEFFVNRLRLKMEIRSLHAYTYVREELEKRAIGGLEFGAPPTRQEMAGLLAAFMKVRSAKEDGSDALNETLLAQDIHTLEAMPPRPEVDVAEELDVALDRRQRAIDAYERALAFIEESMAGLESPAQLSVSKAKRTVQRLVDLSFEEGEGFSLAGLASIKSHDNYTFNHMVNVCVLAIAFGQRLGLNRADLASVGLCALYHDMGKLHIPLDVLNKKTGLTEEEWATMGNHTVYAARTLYPLIERDYATTRRILTALTHHRGFDGSGYPKLRIRTEQGLFARITALCDAFDAMTTKRIYQKQFLPDEALGIIHKAAGKRYDAILVKAFINCMGIFPVGSTVLLTTGELAVVAESNPDPERVHQPWVRIATDTARRPIEGELVDLSQAEHGVRGIVRCVDPEAFGINAAHYAV